ncbi:PREDICTED: uncharacterized protein LOC108372066 [Rhagoletis zephyria]|uniref:uncharacterized protein LOC108372066 n=1 Tax=Rhagoletis zephyria TaxID=28612 RepID=UPI0008112878|nr:PREDICTED: uncharacterized protein LOC108372066 [Rhagoletis zephyria]
MRDVRTVSNLQLPMQSLSISDLHYKHRHLPIRQYSDATPELLIGLDNAHLGIPRRTAYDGSREHTVVLTKLGWVIYGTANTLTQARYHSLFARVSDETSDKLEDLVNDLITNENMGVSEVKQVAEPEYVARAKKLLNEHTKRDGRKFETCLLWRRDDVKLPESRKMAENRFLALGRNFRGDNHLKRVYTTIMVEYVERGYCRKLGKEEAETISERTWYLPHFGVYNPNKPGKLTFVFDAAAESQGVSLNSELLSGPDLSQPLATVLMKFIQKPIGVGYRRDVPSSEDKR